MGDRYLPSKDSIRASSYIDQVAVPEPQIGEIVRVDEHHIPPARDAAITVVQTVDRRVVLVVASNGGQQQRRVCGSVWRLARSIVQGAEPMKCRPNTAQSSIVVRCTTPRSSRQADRAGCARHSGKGNLGSELQLDVQLPSRAVYFRRSFS